MKKIADTAKQRTITLELTEGEMTYIVAGLGSVTPVDIVRRATMSYSLFDVIRQSDGHGFHAKLKDALFDKAVSD